MSGQGDERQGERILVVDDDRAVTRILRAMLEIDGHRVEEAWSGVGLVDRIATSPPRLMLLDVNMPQMSGLEVLGALRASGDRTPVILLTGEDERRRGLDDVAALEPVAWMLKPVALDQLLATVRTMCHEDRDGARGADREEPSAV